MNRALDFALAALLGAILPDAAAIYAVGGQANRIEQLERRVSDLEHRPAIIAPAVDPAKVQCAKLANQYTDPKADRIALKDAMDTLACFRIN